MNNLSVSFFGGLFSVVGLFLLCLFSVIAVKSAIRHLSSIFKKPVATIESPPKPKRKPKKPTTIRSIEIDPEEIDRIYVKKIS